MMSSFMKKGIALVLTVLLMLSVTGAFAGTSLRNGETAPANQSDKIDRILNILDFKFFVKKDGIGYGHCPVYTAPSEDAFRAANGNAVCDTNYAMSVAGLDVSGWLMIRYEAQLGHVRVGYIPPRYVKGYKPEITRLDFEYIPVEAADTIYVTDNPMEESSAFALLEPGEEFYLLAKYTYYGNWWYIECTVDGQVARGFINRDIAQFTVDGEIYTPQIPSMTPSGNPYVGTVTVTGPAKEARMVRQKPDGYSNMVARVYPGDQYPCYGSQRGTGGDWYCIWVDGVWGWISGTVSRFDEN